MPGRAPVHFAHFGVVIARLAPRLLPQLRAVLAGGCVLAVGLAAAAPGGAGAVLVVLLVLRLHGVGMRVL